MSDDKRVGIGTATPQSTLHVESDAFDVLRLTSSNPSGPHLSLDNGSNIAYVSFIKNDFGGDGSVRENAMEINNGGPGGKIHFISGGGNVGSPSMAIAPGGNVGIGTTAPAYPLDVQGNGFFQARVKSTTASEPGQLIVEGFDQSNHGQIQILTRSDSIGISHIFAYRNGVTDLLQLNGSLYVSGNGRVGIGTADPNVPLHTEGKIFINDTTGTTNGQGTTMVIRNQQTNTSIFRIQGPGISTVAEFSSNGNVGIGTANPIVPLHVSITSDPITYIARSIFGPTGSNVINGGAGTSETYYISIYAAGRIRTDDSFVVSSDSRIKKNIAEINDGNALGKLRLVEPAEYDYVDQISRGSKRVFGFIAQQVREHFPEAVTLLKDFVPDVFGLQTLDLASQTVQLPGKAKAGKLRLITLTRRLDVEVAAPSPDVVQLPEGTLTEEDLHEGKVFVYGYEVEDFHALNKDYLFTINFAATQELDRKVQTLETENQGLKTENQTLSSKVVELETRLQGIYDALVGKGILP